MKRIPLLLLASLVAAAPAFAAQTKTSDKKPADKAASGPKLLANSGDWTAAAYGSGAAKACYAFTKAQSSSPSLAKRGAVLLTVTERKGAHDEVTIGAGFSYPKDAKVQLVIGSTKLDFYTQNETAFTEQGSAAVSAMQAGSSASAKSTGPDGKTVTDNFSLSGFSDAFKAISQACS